MRVASIYISVLSGVVLFLYMGTFCGAQPMEKNLPPERGEAFSQSDDGGETCDTLDDIFSLYQPYLSNLGAYEPMYFLVGVDPEQSKFQISLKYRIFSEDSLLAEKYPWVSGIHFGYTQTSFWDLASDSAPFEDTSYKPELFFLSRNLKCAPPWLKGFFLQAGALHESNGRGGDLSRSTNHLYLMPIAVFYNDTNRFGVSIAPRIWSYFNNEDDNNPDLDQYRGYFDLKVKFGTANGFVLGTSFRWAGEGASVQADLTYPLDVLFFRNFDLFFQVQYVNALAESLLRYRERNEALRVGFAIVR